MINREMLSVAIASEQEDSEGSSEEIEYNSENVFGLDVDEDAFSDYEYAGELGDGDDEAENVAKDLNQFHKNKVNGLAACSRAH